jgi:putative transcriptional regulator
MFGILWMERRKSVIKFSVDEILEERGRTFYWLAKETGISHTTLWRLKKDKAQGINFSTLLKICGILDCQPGDVLKLADKTPAVTKRGRSGKK